MLLDGLLAPEEQSSSYPVYIWWVQVSLGDNRKEYEEWEPQELQESNW